MKMIKPNYYKGAGGKDLFDRFEEGLLNEEEFKGFLKGNIFKYITRFEDKNGIEDLKKAQTYLDKLVKLEEKNETLYDKVYKRKRRVKSRIMDPNKFVWPMLLFFKKRASYS